MELNGVTIENLNDFEEMEGSGECTWKLARKALGVTSFGMNFVEIGPGGQIPEHTESERDHEEVFIVLDGNATAVVDGVEKPPRKGPSFGWRPRCAARSATTATSRRGC